MKNDFHSSQSDEQMENRLWEYIDGISSAEEQTLIGQLILSDRLWKEKYEELQSVHELMLGAALEQPSMRFAKNVMEEITRLQINPAARNYINKRVIWGIAGFFFATIIGFVIYSVGLIQWSAPVETDPKYSIDLNRISEGGEFSRIFNSSSASIFMMVNIILALFLLDRFLANKRKKFSEEN